MTEPEALTPEREPTVTFYRDDTDGQITVVWHEPGARSALMSRELLDQTVDELNRLRAENNAWRNHAKWTCTRDNRTYPCGDCDGCRAGVWNSHATTAKLQARIDAAIALCDANQTPIHTTSGLRRRVRATLTGENQ